MTAATSPTPTSHPAPPEDARCPEGKIWREVFYTNPTQPNPVRVVYLEEPAAFACAVLTHPLAVAIGGAGLALKPDAVRETPAAALAHAVVTPSGK